MAKRCAICGKSPQYGHNVSHSKVRTNRRFLPNLQIGRVRITEVAHNLKSAVRFEVERSTGVPVTEINVFVQGVHGDNGKL